MQKDEFNDKNVSYIMPEYFDTSRLVIANLETVTNVTEVPSLLTTDQKYQYLQ